MSILEHGDTLGFWGQALRKDFTNSHVALRWCLRRIGTKEAMVLTKREETGNMLRAATAAMADWVVCGGCRRGRE